MITKVISYSYFFITRTNYSIVAESQGIEPCDPITRVYGLAIRCITILPALELVED